MYFTIDPVNQQIHNQTHLVHEVLIAAFEDPLCCMWEGCHNPYPRAWLPVVNIAKAWLLHALPSLTPISSLTVHHYYSVPVFTLQQHYLHCSLDADLAQCGYTPSPGFGSTAIFTVISATW